MTKLNAGWIVHVPLLALAVLPSALYAYLGSFSRMQTDDFRFLSLGLEHGPWTHMLYWRDRWNGSYADYFVHGLLAPFGESAPSVFPGLLVATWLLGLTWLFAQCLELVQLREHRWAWALAGASLMVAGCLNALPSAGPFLWLAASIRYILPLALFGLYLALMLFVGKRVRSNPGLVAVALLSGLACLVCAGLSELYLAFQFCALALLSAFLLAYAPRRLRAPAFAIAGGGILGTLASLTLQLTAPGLSIRTEATALPSLFEPLPYLMPIARAALGDMHRALMRPASLESFWLLFAFMTLLWLRTKTTIPNALGGAVKLGDGRLANLLVFAAQLALLPVVWAHSSDDGHIFGRFSASFMLVVMANLGLILGTLTLALRYRQFQAFLRRKPMRQTAYASLLLLSGMALLVLPTLRAMDSAATIVLFVSALSLLLLAWREWASQQADPAARLSLIALIASALALLNLAALMIADQLHYATYIPRHFCAAVYALASLALFWGTAAGHSFRQLGENIRTKLQSLAAAVLALAWLSLVVGQISQIPDLALYASEWDNRHERLLELRASGETHALIPSPAFDLDHFILFGEKRVDVPEEDIQAMLQYYGLESITLIGES